VARIALALSIAALAVGLLGSTPLGAAAQELVIPRGAVGTEELAAGAVTGAKVKDHSLGRRDFAQGQIPRGPVGPAGPPGTIEGVAAGGDLSGTYPGPVLAPDSVATAEIADGSLRLADTAVLSGQVRVDLPALKAHSCISSSAAVQGLKPFDRTLVLPTQNLPVGAFVTQVFNTGVSNRVLFRVCNATTKPLDPPLGGWAYVVWRQ
jgi:hypothetical protein